MDNLWGCCIKCREDKGCEKDCLNCSLKFRCNQTKHKTEGGRLCNDCVDKDRPSNAPVSHGYCPECFNFLMNKIKSKGGG
jgi:hypothetical protein